MRSHKEAPRVFITTFFYMKLREQLVSDFAGIVIGTVKDNGWLTHISNEVGINRREFNRKGMSKMKLHRLLRILTALAWRMPWKRFRGVWMTLGEIIYEMGNDHFPEFCDENTNVNQTKNG